MRKSSAPKSVTKQKKEATQEFFNKSVTKETFTFNKAPFNKDEAKKELVEQRERPQKRSAFMAKLYKDDNELDEIKVLLGDQIDSDIEADTKPLKPRDAKAVSKSKTTSELSKPSLISKIGRLNLTKGSVALFAVMEVQQGQYAIVSHTRNMKGYINLKESEIKLKVGQLVIASIYAMGKAEHEGPVSKKLQLSLDPATIYRTLSAEKVTPGMLLQAVVESKEEKGYFLNLGFKDGAKGFLAFQTDNDFLKGDLVHVNVKSASSKLVKCELNVMQTVQSTETTVINEHSLRPGYLVSAKVAKIFENGLEISFLGGMKGTVFVDHIGRDKVTAFKVGEKMQARVTAHDIQGKTTTLSLLPHILEFCTKQVGCEIGQVFESVKVQQIAFGTSFIIRLSDTQTGFLHKSHLPVSDKPEQKNVEEEEESKKKDKKKKKIDSDDLAVGSVIERVRVKEINFFDGVPLLSMKSEIVASPALDYNSLEIGQFVNATIESVNELRKTITLRINDFVKGTLRIEHIADYPVKVLPPKFTQTEKQIKVRVFSNEDRTLLFTKKDSLMKHDVPIYKTIKEVKAGDKIVGVVVAANEHGHIVKSFGEVKGLLTFADIKNNSSKLQGELKPGSILKAYVLFNKKGSGLALTLDKKLARKGVAEANETQKRFSDYLPDEDEIEQFKTTFSSLWKHSQDCVGKVFSFKVVENRSDYLVLKTVLEKKAKFAVMPKPLSTNFGISLPIDGPEFTFDGYVFELFNGIPIVSLNSTLAKFSNQIPSKTDDLQNGTRLYLGLIDSADEKLGVTVRFNSFTVQVAVKDLQFTSDLQQHYPIGFPVRVGVNKSGRPSLKQIVINKIMTQQQLQDDRTHMLDQFIELHKKALQAFKIGQPVVATVQLVKEYGLILKVSEDYTGFIINEQKKSGKTFKEGASIEGTLLDIDYDRKMLDLSERVINDVKAGKDKSKAVVELTKDSYMIVSLKQNRQKFGVCLLQESLNKHFMQPEYEQYHVGDEIDIRVVREEDDFMLALPKAEPQSTKQTLTQVSLSEGALVNGVLKSIKGHCLFVQIGVSNKVPQIGRLHRVECGEEFATFKVGDRVSAKILRVMEDQGKTWIELSRRSEHMKAASLDESMSALLSLDTMKEGQKVQAMVIDVTAEASSLLQIQVSPFVHGQILFSDLINAEDLKTKPVNKLVGQYKIGSLISVYYTNGKFTTKKEQPEFKKGDLVPVRFVKSNVAYGMTVQLSEKHFGNIEMCELSDEITSNLIGQFKQKSIFLARVIDTDKKGRLMLSSRDSVIQHWDTIYTGSTAAFQTFNKKDQAQGNLRNKILKFGAKLAVNQGDLFIGYVSNISKAGCFVNIGHNTTVRIGLNELDDSESFDFHTQMPIGRQVVGRITKAFDLGDGARFNASLRRSLAIYGVHQVNKNALKPGDLITAFVLAVAKDSVFAQIKGSYLKLNVKGAPSTTQVGSLIETRLVKVSSEAIKADFVQASNKKLDPSEDTAKHVYDSVLLESAQDLTNLTNQHHQEEIDIEAAVQKRRQMTATEVQIRDLQTLAELEEDQSDGDDEEEAEDSDDEDMKRIISKNHEDSDAAMEVESGEDDDESMEEDMSEGEESEQEDASMDSEEEEVKATKLTGKKALRAQITQEKEIRAKETKMRSETGAEPKSVNDFERLLVSDQDQSYLWIKYMAFMLDKLDAEAARRVVERAVKSVGITAESDKLNLWIAYMNLENQYGTQETLQKVTNRALEVNDRQKVYLQLINIYRQSNKLEFVEDLYKKLCKKYHESLEIWSQYIEFLFDAPADGGFTKAKVILQRSLQALPKALHINIISKFGMLEFKAGQNESGRTMFEGIITNYPKRMDIWSIYMDMEVKYGGVNGQDNSVQARHLFERCLSLAEIQKKPKKMKLVFRKYMEFEHANGNKSKVDALRQRVEEYLQKLFKEEDNASSSQSEQ